MNKRVFARAQFVASFIAVLCHFGGRARCNRFPSRDPARADDANHRAAVVCGSACQHGCANLQAACGISAALQWSGSLLHTFPDVRVASFEPVAESKTCSSPGAPPASSTDPSGEDPRRPREEPAVHPGTRSAAVWAFVAISHTMTRPSPDLLATRPPGNDTKLSTRLPWPAGDVGKATQSLLEAAVLVAGAASARSACSATKPVSAWYGKKSPACTHLHRQRPFQNRSAACSHEERGPARLQARYQRNAAHTSQAGRRTRKTAVVAVGEVSVATHASVLTFQTRTCKKAQQGEPADKPVILKHDALFRPSTRTRADEPCQSSRGASVQEQLHGTPVDASASATTHLSLEAARSRISCDAAVAVSEP